MSRVPAYLAKKKGNRRKFWHELFSAWWEQYPWRLTDDEEPPTDDPEEMASLALAGPNDSVQKGAVVKRLEGVRSFTFPLVNRD